jgi:drug/metabolite transporter (DMT)-like permease
VAVLFGVTLLAEPLSWQIIAGGVLIAGSVAMVNLIKKKGDGKHRIFS